MTSKVKAVLFDLGDTLWHFPNFPSRQAIREETVRRIFALLRRWGIEPDGQLRYLGRDIRLAAEHETERAFHGDCLSPHYPSLCRKVAAGFDLALSEAQAEELWEAWNLEGQFYGRQLYPDVLETLEWLRRRGCRLGSITNRAYSGPRFWHELRELGLTDYFEVVAISCDVGYLKPHPRIFRHALDGLGLEPTSVVMVGDSLRADVGGAKALGMAAVWRRPPLGEPVEAGADRPQGEEGPAPDYAIDHIGELRQLPIFGHE